MQATAISKARNIDWTLVKNDWFLLLCLFVSVSDLFVYARFMIIIVFFILIRKPISTRCRNTSIALLFFSLIFVICFALKGIMTSRSDFVGYLFPPAFYMAGCYLGSKYKKHDTVLVVVLFLILLSYAASHFIVLAYSVFTSDQLILDDRIFMAIDNGSVYNSATVFGIYISVLLTGFAFIIVPRQKGALWWVRYLGIAIAVISLWGMAMTVTRTSVVEAVIMIIVSVLIMMIERNRQSKITGLLIGFIALSVAIYLFIQNSAFFEFFDAFDARNESAYYGVQTAGARSFRWEAALKSIITSPMGTDTGRIVVDGRLNYAHNMWLDIAITTGWIPFIIIFVISYRNCVDSFRLLKNNGFQYFTRLYFTVVFVIFMLSCSMEPVLEGSYHHFLCYLIFCGITSEMAVKK